MRDLLRLLELHIPRRRAAGAIHDVGGLPERTGDAGGRAGRQLPRVDRHAEAPVLENARRCEADGAAADDGRRSRPSAVPHEIRGQHGRAPGQRHARAAVSVVVDQELVAQALRAHDEPGRPVRAQAHLPPDDPVGRDIDGREMPHRAAARCSRSRRARLEAARAAAAQRNDRRGASHPQEPAAAVEHRLILGDPRRVRPIASAAARATPLKISHSAERHLEGEHRKPHEHL